MYDFIVKNLKHGHWVAVKDKRGYWKEFTYLRPDGELLDIEAGYCNIGSYSKNEIEELFTEEYKIVTPAPVLLEPGTKVELIDSYKKMCKTVIQIHSTYVNTVIHGNCLDILPEIKQLSGGGIVIVTDPPFNVGYHYNDYKDNLGADEYYEMLGNVFSGVPFVVIHYPEEIYKIAYQMGDFPEKVVSWVYNSNTAKQHRDIAFFGVKPDFTKYGQPYKNPTDKRIAKRIAEGKSARLYDWWEINQVKNVSKEKTAHTCQMPLEVMKRIIAILPEDKIIVDPFGGSGTTALACKELGRDYIIIEQDKMYVDIINARLNQ